MAAGLWEASGRACTVLLAWVFMRRAAGGLGAGERGAVDQMVDAGVGEGRFQALAPSLLCWAGEWSRVASRCGRRWLRHLTVPWKPRTWTICSVACMLCTLLQLQPAQAPWPSGGQAGGWEQRWALAGESGSGSQRQGPQAQHQGSSP